MKILKTLAPINLFCLTALLINCQSSFSQSSNQAYEEKNGLLVIEIESHTPVEGWSYRNDIPGFNGSGFFEWTGEDQFNKPGIGLLEYIILINRPGTYQFHWFCKVGIGNDFTEHNDSWLRIPDAADYYAVNQAKTDTVRPHGICTYDCPNGAGDDGWFKVYSSNTDEWTWSSRTSDHDPHNIRVDFDSNGIYTIQISGRSNGHFLDKFMLFHEDSLTYREAIELVNSN